MPQVSGYMTPQTMMPVEGDGTAARELLPEWLSPSSTAEFIQCPRRFYAKKVAGAADPGTWATVKGTLVHAVLERLFEDHPRGARSRELALSLVEPEWVRLTCPDLDGDDEEVQRAEAQAADCLQAVAEGGADRLLTEVRQMVEAYFAMENPDAFTPHANELALAASLAGVPMRGIVDRLDVVPTADGGRAFIVSDYKTGAVRPKWLAMFVYALLVQEVLGVTPVALRLVFVREGHPDAILTETVTAAKLDETRATLARVWSQMRDAAQSGVWPAVPSPLCRFCPVRASCPAFDEQVAAAERDGDRSVAGALHPQDIATG